MSKQQTVKQSTGCGRLSTEKLGKNKHGEPYKSCCPDSNYVEISAVDWLFNQLPDHLRLSRNGFEMLQQAKVIEKQQYKFCKLAQ